MKNRTDAVNNLKRINTIEIKGYCSLFKAQFSKNVLNFGNLLINTKSVETFEIHNLFEYDLEFSFLIHSSTFKLSIQNGIIKKNSSREIKVIFKGTKPSNYFKRFFCIIKGHWLLHIDCFASVKDYLIHPLPSSIFINPAFQKFKRNSKYNPIGNFLKER